MGSDTVAGGGHIVAFGLGKTGVYASANGREAKKFPVPQGFDAETFALAINTEFGKFAKTGLTILVIGTREDGSPGWDAVDPDELREALAPTDPDAPPQYEVVFLSEAQALARQPGRRSPAAWIILATARREGELVGSARWWVERDGEIVLLPMIFAGQNFGQVYAMSGDNFADAPGFVASMAGDILTRHPEVVVYIWSQDGMAQFHGYQQPDGLFWQSPPAGFDPSRIVILPSALEMLRIASAPAGGAPASGGATDSDPPAAGNGWRPARNILGPAKDDPLDGE